MSMQLEMESILRAIRCITLRGEGGCIGRESVLVGIILIFAADAFA